ncbi:MAG: glycosyltransferase family 39 protein, partial [Planctomycetes bacterium]|nr:glycosyltransferase family 39 protein [Planctomycetota bacterium]
MCAGSGSLLNRNERAPRKATGLGGWVCLTIAAAVLICFRLHAFELPLETDECNYAYIGERLLDGDRLYEDVWDHQPPGVFVMFAGVTALFGQSDAVIRWMAVGFSLASLAMIFHVARRHYGLEAGAFAAAVFAIVSSDPGTAGEGCNREIYMNVFALAAVATLMRRDDRRHA